MTKLDDTDYETLINSMTVEDAVEVLRNTRCYGTMDIAKNVILKALEQQPKTDTLDKIRAEIKALSPEPTAYDVVDGNPVKDAVWETLNEVLQIIDKYKAKSEE
jgi:hypothetical protein